MPSTQSTTVYVLRDSTGRHFGAYAYYTEAKLVGLRLFGTLRPFAVEQAVSK